VGEAADVLERVVEREAAAERLEAEMAEVCGVLNAATGRLVGLIARVLETEAWQGWGIRSAEQWVGWKCGMTPERARRLVAMARRVPELPETFSAPVAEVRRVSFNHTESGSWRLSAELPADEGAVVEKALTELRDELFRVGEAGPGRLGIEGDADEPDGMVFTDDQGRRLDACGHPVPPGATTPPPGNWIPPTGEPLDPWAIYFNEPAVVA